ncbi:hypothetical protein HQQ80_05780 [Microbacteriaceae bacterium VKM Ac-2855]|nr:hypothetical protein [Microbacteriaceae bacterium VKM Ac-2855]
MNTDPSQNVPPADGRGDADARVAELQARLDTLLNDPLDSWVENMYVGGSAAEFESTVSWRITKPLRAVRTFQMRVSQLGLGTAIAHSARYAKRRLGRRR